MKTTIFKNIAWLWLSCAMATSALLLTGCDDDDDGNANIETLGEASAFTATDGSKLYLAKIYTYNSNIVTEFEYNDDGLMTSWNDWEVVELTSVNPLKYVCAYYEGEGYITQTFKNFNTNSSGYLTGYNVEWVEKWGDDYCRDTESISLSYNSYGQLTKITCSISCKDYDADDNETYTETEKTTTTLTWDNNLITRAASTETWETSDGNYGTYTDTWVYSYDTEYENVTLQYPHYKNEAFDCIYYTTSVRDEPFLYIGLFGKGPEYLPSSYTHTYNNVGYEDEEEYEYSGSDRSSFSYTFNSDGSIHYDGEYYYGYQDDVTEKSLSFTELSDNQVTKADRKTKLGHRLKHRAKRATMTSEEE